MKIIKPYFVIESKIRGVEILKTIELFGRNAYKSENSISENSASQFVKMIIDRGHLSVIEHLSVTVRIICDRGVTHEIVRHRLASYTQESTRYCNYSQGKYGGEITIIKPCFWDADNEIEREKYKIWKDTMKKIEQSYLRLIELGATPQEARSVLPNSLKSEIIMTMNLREWRHFFELRTSDAAHPQMREIIIPLLTKFKEKIPVVFDDIQN